MKGVGEGEGAPQAWRLFAFCSSYAPAEKQKTMSYIGNGKKFLHVRENRSKAKRKSKGNWRKWQDIFASRRKCEHVIENRSKARKSI